MSLKSPLGAVKHLGSAKSGTTHFIHQRISAVFLIALCAWALYFFARIARMDGDIIHSLHFCDLVILTMFVGASLYHGYLGMRVVYEDYMHCKIMLNFSIMLTQFVCFITFIAYLISVCFVSSHSMIIEYLK